MKMTWFLWKNSEGISFGMLLKALDMFYVFKRTEMFFFKNNAIFFKAEKIAAEVWTRSKKLVCLASRAFLFLPIVECSVYITAVLTVKHKEQPKV